MRYEYQCKNCSRNILIYLHEGKLDESLLYCENCGSPDLKLLAFYAGLDRYIDTLRERIEELWIRFEDVEERLAEGKGISHNETN